MKKLVVTMSLLVVAAVAFSAVYATAAADVCNKQCPVKKSDLKKDCPTVEVVCKSGKKATVGVCCMDCLGKYSKDVTKYPVTELKSDPAVKTAQIGQ